MSEINDPTPAEAVAGNVELSAMGTNEIGSASSQAGTDGPAEGTTSSPTAEAAAGAPSDPPQSTDAPEQGQSNPPAGYGNKAAAAPVVAKKKVAVDPAKLLEPIRTNPIKALEARKRRLDRQVGLNMPEVHYIGQLVSMEKVINDPTEGAFCRWKIDHGKVWELLGGEVMGQTHISYCSINEQETLTLSHPLDVHFAAAGLQGWGAPRLSLQCYRLDWHGRKVLSGYGFAHLPLTAGPHRLTIQLWRPVGTPDQELSAYLLGESPALINHEPIYEGAWQDRCRLLTVASGSVDVELFVVNRFLQQQGVEGGR